MEHKMPWIGLLLFFLQASANAQTGQMVAPPSEDTPVPPFRPPVTRPFPPPVTTAPTTETLAPSTGTLSGTPGSAPGSISGSAPQECSSEGFIFQNGQLILGTSRVNPQVYMIKNNSDYQQLLLSRPTNTAMSAHWESRLDQGQWSALAMSQPNLVINCFGRKPGVAGYVDCKGVLSICSLSKAPASGGTHWISENQSLGETIGSVRH